jgi:hypothetical protein
MSFDSLKLCRYLAFCFPGVLAHWYSPSLGPLGSQKVLSSDPVVGRLEAIVGPLPMSLTFKRLQNGMFCWVCSLVLLHSLFSKTNRSIGK